MIGLSMMLCVGAASAFAGGGFLFGARLGRGARRELAAMLDEREARVRELTAAADATAAAAARDDAGKSRVEAIRGDLRALASAVSAQERSHEALKADLHRQLASIEKLSPDPETLRKDLERLVLPLMQHRDRETRKIGDMMKEMLAPVMEKERLGRELMAVRDGAGLHELPRVLDAIADKGAFSTVVLADDVGLPLASNRSGRNVDAIAGVSAMLLTLAERTAALAESRPSAVIVQDEHGQTAIYRVFQVGASRFVLTAVGRGVAIEPDALDPALPKLHSALARPDLVA